MADVNYQKILRPQRKNRKFSRPEGAGNFDNMDDYNIVDNISCLQGTIQHTPANAKDIVNKEYVDATSGITDHTLLTNIGTNTHITIDTHIASGAIHFLSGAIMTELERLSGAVTRISGALTNLSGATTDHIGDGSDPHGTILSQTNIVSNEISGGKMTITSDFETMSGAYIANMIYGTGVNPPNASDYTRGSIYVQYTP